MFSVFVFCNFFFVKTTHKRFLLRSHAYRLTHVLSCEFHLKFPATTKPSTVFTEQCSALVIELKLTNNNIINTQTIITTRPKPAYRRQGLAGSWG